MEKLKMNLSNKVLCLRWLGASGFQDIPKYGIFENGKRLFFSDGVDIWEILTIKSGYPNMVVFGNTDSLIPTSIYNECWLLSHEIQFQEIINVNIHEGLYKMENGGLLLNDGEKTYYIRIMEVEE